MISAPTLVTFATKVTGTPAHGDGNKNLIIPIHIDHNCMAAFFECGIEEHVGSHAGRHVNYIADEECTLHFTKSNFPGDTELPKGTAKQVFFPNAGESEFYVTQDSSTPQTGTMQAEMEALASPSTVQKMVPPRLVVP